jgi:hypothetical protein
MFWIFSITIVFAIALYLLILLRKELSDRYTWQKQIIYIDYINKEKIQLLTSTESLTISSLNKDDYSKKALLAFEEILNNLTDELIPFRLTIGNSINKFLEEKNIFASLSLYNSDSIKLFTNEFKLDGPSFFIEKNIYNIYLNYEIQKGSELKQIVINNESDYLNFLQELYKYNDNFICKTNYSVYKQVGKDEKAQKVYILSLITKIGPSYSYINYKKPFLIDVDKFYEF